MCLVRTVLSLNKIRQLCRTSTRIWLPKSFFTANEERKNWSYYCVANVCRHWLVQQYTLSTFVAFPSVNEKSFDGLSRLLQNYTSWHESSMHNNVKVNVKWQALTRSYIRLGDMATEIGESPSIMNEAQSCRLMFIDRFIFGLISLFSIFSGIIGIRRLNAHIDFMYNKLIVLVRC